MKAFQLLQNLLFVDIETVPEWAEWEQVPEKMQLLWEKKALSIDKEADAADLYSKKAGIYAEFGKIIAIGVGYFCLDEASELSFRVKTFKQQKEEDLLQAFHSLLQKPYTLVAHNGKEFDFPYLCRRFFVKGIALPKSLQIQGKKPWGIPHIDTMEMWTFGDRKSYTSLDLLATILDISSSKGDMEGSKVRDVYYNEKNLEKIAEYCSNDVVVTARLFLKLKSLPPISEKAIIKV
ncbi:3'-5' exonuclease [Rapidithrix thailandica]|uniref:3'-5' exonuclease n=1 Tax=Rapidithrix thailandica TaxID=413964 RepID=A0AAW9RP92_9BACT